MLATARARRAAPSRFDREDAGKRIEMSLLSMHRSVGRLPPVSSEKASHHTVAAAAVPDERPPGAENARKLDNDAPIVGGVGEKPKGREEVQNRIEAGRPLARQPPHFTTTVAQRRADAARLRAREELSREIESVDAESGLGEEVGVASLAAGHVEDTCAGGKAENVDEARDLLAVALEREDGLVLAQVMRIEIARPPLDLGLGR